MLAGIAAEEFFVELAADGGDHHVLRGLDLADLLGPLGEPILQLLGGEVEPVELVDRVEIDRDRHLHAVHFRQHPVLVEAPFGEAREMVEDLLRVGVEDMRTVLVDQQPVVVITVIGVAADMVAAVDEKNALVALARKTLRQNAARKAGADNQPIVHSRSLRRRRGINGKGRGADAP